MTFGMQPLNQPPGIGGLAFLAPVALNPDAGMVDAGGMPLIEIAHVTNVGKEANTADHRAQMPVHPWRVLRPSAGVETTGRDNTLGTAPRLDFQTAFASASSASSESEASDEAMFGAFLPSPVDVDSIDVDDVSLARTLFDAPRVAQPVLCAASLATLHVCASSQNLNTRGASLEGRNHPVVMPDGRSERAQICRDIVSGSLLGTDGRNGTTPFDPSREAITKTVADTARRWTGKPSLAGKKEWSTACLMNTPPEKFIASLNDRLHAGTRLLPLRESTEWMLRVGFSDGLPMHQAFVRGDLPDTVGLGTDEWVKLALGIEQLGARHWDMRHVEVVGAAALPATNTKAFTALATSLSSTAPHIATQRLRNQLTMRGVPTAPAEATSAAPDSAA